MKTWNNTRGAKMLSPIAPLDQKLGMREWDLQQHSSVYSFVFDIPFSP